MRWIVLALLVFASGAKAAQYTDILILDEFYSTTNSVTVHDPWYCHQDPSCEPTTTTTTTQQANSASPLSTELDLGSFNWAKGSADTFSVSASANGWSHATAESSLSFRVLQDTSVLLTFGGAASTWSWGAFSLVDLSTGEDLYAQNFSPSYSGFNPRGVSPSDASFSGFLDSDHLYRLTLRGDADAQYDGVWSMSLSVSGLYPIAAPVPEPEAYALMLAGLAFVGFAVRRRRI